MNTVNSLVGFFKQGLWKLDISKYNRFKRFSFYSLQILVLSLKNFISDKCALRSSALTFYSLLSIVPVLAVAFAIAKGFGLAAILEEQIRNAFAGQEEVMAKAIEFSQTTLKTTQGGLIAGISILILLWSVIKLLNHIENTLNSIWNVVKPRSFFRKLTDYITLIIVAPIIIIISSGVTVFISTRLEDITQEGLFFDFTGSFLLNLMQLAPFILIGILFTLSFIIIPNKNIKFIPALIGGIIAGIAFEFLQHGYVYFQLAMSRYNTIYGSFAALPLFLIWLQTSWMIILFGAEIAKALQTKDESLFHLAEGNLSYRRKLATQIAVLHVLAKEFEALNIGQDANKLASNLNLPVGQIIEDLDRLENAGLISKTNKDGEELFQIAKPISRLTVAFVIDQLEMADNATNEENPNQQVEGAYIRLKELYSKLNTQEENLLITELAIL